LRLLEQQQQQHAQQQHHNGKQWMQMQFSLFSTSISPTAEEEEDHTYTTSSGDSARLNPSSSTSAGGLYRLLQPEERQILQEQRQLTKAVRQMQQEAGMLSSLVAGDAGYQESSISESAFCIVVAGEFNAGKSTVINALLGEKLLETGPLPTTDAITLLTSSNTTSEEMEDGTEAKHQYPSSIIHHEISNVPLLQDLAIVDTPGTNAILLDHTATTMRLLPSADLILFVTSADRPFCESEREMLHDMTKHYRKAVVILINKMDIFDAAGGHYGQAEKKKVTDFVSHHAGELLGMSHPIVLPISSRDALSAKLLARQRQQSSSSASSLSSSAALLEESAIWQRSNFAALETFLKETLTTETKIKSKLSSPIGVTQGILESCLAQVKKERMELETHVATLRLLQSHFSGWQSELLNDMNRMNLEMYDYLARQEGERGLVLLRRFSIWQYYHVCLLDGTNRLQNEWDKTRPLHHDVMANECSRSSIIDIAQQTSPAMTDSSRSIDPYLSTLIQEAAESVATRGRAQGQAVIEFLGQRPSIQNQSLIGSITAASTFEDTRQGLVDQMTRAVQRHVSDEGASSAASRTKSSRDVRDGQHVLQTLQRWAYLSAGLNSGAIGSLAMSAASSELMDILSSTGVAAVFAALSGWCLSHGRWKVARQYQEDWTSRAQGLRESLEKVSRRELDRVDRRIQDGVAPYTRFVQAEQRRLDGLKAKCQELQSTAHRLRNRIHKLG
jgi:small GTP-binding protein